MPRTYRWQRVTIASLPLLWQVQVAGAQSDPLACDASLHPLAGASGYAARAADPRCEGVYQSPVSATGLEVVSVMVGPFAFDIETDDRLIVSLPDLGGLDVQAVNVRAVALPLKTYYRMDALVAPGRTMRWPVATILRPWDLVGARLGAFGWIDRDGERIMIPVAVNPSAESSAADASRVLIKLRSPVSLDRMVWREIADNGAVSEWQPVVEGTARGGEAIPFELPAGPAGVVHLDFRAKRPNSDDWLALDLRVWRPAA